MAVPPITYYLSRTDTIGVTLSAAVGFFSMTCVFVMFLFMFRNIYREMQNNPLTWRLLIKEPIDLYLLLLFIGDLMEGVSNVLNIRWVHTGIVVEGAYCTAQGGLQQFSETGVAMTTLVIAGHSFVTVLRGKGEDKNLLVASIVMAIVWLYVFLFVVIGITSNAKKDYIIPDPYWCWLSPQYRKEQIFGEYLWFWITLVFSFLTYIPLYFISRGNMTVNGCHISFQQVQTPNPGHYRARGLLAYPIVYSFLVLPLSIVRWKGFNSFHHGARKPFPPASNLTTIIFFELSGAFNVLLLLTTRQGVLLFGKQSSSTATSDETIPVTKQGRLPNSSIRSPHRPPQPQDRLLSNEIEMSRFTG